VLCSIAEFDPVKMFEQSLKSTKDKAKWLETEINKGPQKKEHKDAISKELISQKAKWLQEDIEKTPEKKDHSEPISKSLASEKAKWLEEEIRKDQL